MTTSPDGIAMKSNPLGWFEIYVQDRERAKAASAGGSIVKEKFSIGQYGFISMIIDTKGNMVGLQSMQ